ncbi:MAG: GxxExxY protein [Anaerolineae bacterium]|nr:GxxExxY protein [Anaerolineae bacterium]
MSEDALSNEIIKAAIEVHRTLGGPGLLESVYEEALVWELKDSRLEVERQKQLPIVYKGIVLAEPLRLDIVVNNLVIVECKAVVNYHPIFEAQALTYLRITGLRLALVINFGEKMLKNGIHRVVNKLRRILFASFFSLCVFALGVFKCPS